MPWRTFEIQRAPGFRFNLTDLIFLVFLGALGGALFYIAPDSSLGWIPLYLGASFFLFCNVFRIGNHLEPFWYVPFTLCAGAAIYTFRLEWFWWAVLGLLEPLKWGLIGYRIWRGPYVGAGYRLLARRSQ